MEDLAVSPVMGGLISACSSGQGRRGRLPRLGGAAVRRPSRWLMGVRWLPSDRIHKRGGGGDRPRAGRAVAAGDTPAGTGRRLRVRRLWMPFLVSDRNLHTGQNPASSGPLAETSSRWSGLGSPDSVADPETPRHLLSPRRLGRRQARGRGLPPQLETHPNREERERETWPPTGRCLCGNVTYSAESDPLITAICHCSNCQHQTGSTYSLVVAVPRPSLKIDGSTLATFDTTTEATGAVHASSATTAARRW